jgi:hypothetical protein
MAKLDGRVTVRINGIDIAHIVRSVTVKIDEETIDIELLHQSESGDAHRHLLGLKKAKN